jgi:hypothetical protein
MRIRKNQPWHDWDHYFSRTYGMVRILIKLDNESPKYVSWDAFMRLYNKNIPMVKA